MPTVNPADRFGQHWSDAHDLDFRPSGLGDGIGGDDFLDFGISDALVAELGEDSVGYSGIDPLGSMLVENFRGGGEGACGLGHVVHQEDVAAFDLADDVHGFDSGGADAVFGDDGELGTEGVCISASHFHSTDVGRDDSEIGGIRVAFAEVADKHGFCVEVIDWDVEKPLDLRRVEVHGEDAVDAGGGE